VYGAGEESLANVAAYAYTVTGGQIGLPPSTPTLLQILNGKITWTAVSDADIAGYRLRIQIGANTDWGSAAPLHGGLITADYFVPTSVPGGVITILCKSVDSLGNESTSAAYAIANLGDIPVDNIFQTWPIGGTIDGTSYAWNIPAGAFGCAAGSATIGGVVFATSLIANSDTKFWSVDSAAAAWSQSAPAYWPAQTWAKMQFPFSITTTLSGTLLADYFESGVNAINGDAITIEYQRGSQLPFWGLSSTGLSWGSGASLYWAPPGAWQMFNGAADVFSNETVNFRLTISGGQNRGAIGALAIRMDVPDIVESGGPISISSAGTRIPLSSPTKFKTIKSVQMTIVNSGGTPTSGPVYAFIVDKDAALGPLVRLYDISGFPHAGTIDYTIQGY
jgi:hypothetical protein